MVEQVTINPEEVRGYGNICEGHTLEDFIVSSSGLAKEKENVHGALTDVYRLVYSLYGLMFDFDKGNKQLYLQVAEADTLSFGFDTVNKQLYLVDENDTGFNLGFDEDTNELYITDDAPPIVHNYTLALDSDSYTTSGSLSVSATLLDDGVAVSGATVSFTGGDSAVTATTNSSGVATATVTFSASGTLTASYSTATDTATVTVQSYIVDISGMTDQSNEFGSILNFRSNGSSGSGSMSYDSTNHYYVLSNTSTGQERFIPITALTGLNDFKLTFEAQVVTTHLFGFGEFVGSTNTNCSVFIGTDTNKFTKHQGSDTAIASGAAQATWYSFTVTIDSTGYYITIKDLNDNVKVDNYRCTISNSNTTQYGFTWGWQGTSQRFYLRNIKAEYI